MQSARTTRAASATSPDAAPPLRPQRSASRAFCGKRGSSVDQPSRGRVIAERARDRPAIWSARAMAAPRQALGCHRRARCTDAPPMGAAGGCRGLCWCREALRVCRERAVLALEAVRARVSGLGQSGLVPRPGLSWRGTNRTRQGDTFAAIDPRLGEFRGPWRGGWTFHVMVLCFNYASCDTAARTVANAT